MYYIPHVVDSIEGGDKFGLLDRFKEKIVPINLADSIFEAVHDGMEGVMESVQVADPKFRVLQFVVKRVR